MAKMTAKKALLTSILSLLVCVTMLVGTTFAWFTDSVTSGTNRIIAGNLDVEVYHTSASVATAETVEGKTNLFRNDDGEAMLWEPGAVSYENLTVKNIGTLAFKYAINMNVTDYNAVNGTNKTLLDVLKVKILKGEDIITAIDRASILALDWTADDVQTLGEFTDSDELYPVGNVPTGEASEKAFQIIVYWQPTANDNDYNLNNGKKSTDETPLFIEFGINLVAAQFTYEEDSFGNDYDDGTSLPALPVTINKTFKSAAVNHNDTLNPNETVKIVNAKNVTVAELESTSAQAIINTVNTIIAEDKKDDTNVNTVFTLSIETTEVKEDSVTYEIDLNAVTTYTTNSDVTATQTLTKEQVNTALAAAEKLVVAEVDIGAGLHDVTVKHSGVAMSPLASAAEDAEGYYYDITTGKLTIKTKSFSPFTIEYRTEYAAKVGETYYMSAEKAFKAATASDTVVFLSDCKLNVANIPVEINFDLNGKTLDLGSRGTVSKTYDGNSTALKYFAGGYGTEEKPFLIYNYETMQNVSKLYDSYNYFKVAIEKTNNGTIDCTGWVPVKLNGSFDGSGVKFTNVTACLFQNVGYQLQSETIVLKDFDATMNVSANGQYGAAALIKNIFNSGKTQFNNVDVHGYLEGYWNMGSYYNYGTANYDDVGADYEVEFIDCVSDATLVCASGNVIGGLLGHAYEGKGHSFTLRVTNSEYTGHMYTTTGNGKGNKYYGMTSDYYNANNHFYFNGVLNTFNNGSSENASAYTNSTKINNVVAVKGDEGYTVAKQDTATKIVVTITAQLSAFDANDAAIANLSGITMVISTTEITDLDAETIKVFNLFDSVEIVNNADDFGATIADGKLSVNVASSSDYKTGNVRLQINQYDSTGAILSAGTIDIATRANLSSTWTVK